jgi:hypothetical protein
MGSCWLTISKTKNLMQDKVLLSNHNIHHVKLAEICLSRIMFWFYRTGVTISYYLYKSLPPISAATVLDWPL